MASPITGLSRHGRNAHLRALMGTLSRSYGRRVKPLDLTPAAHQVALLIPAMLSLLLASLSLRLIKYARFQLLSATRPASPARERITEPVNPDVVNIGGLSLFSPEVRAWEEEIRAWSEEYELPPNLVAIVMQIESCGAPDAVSSAGALGLFQVMPFHFSLVDDPLDPDVNASRGLEYLSQSYALAGGAIDKTLAGYNGGHSVINRDPSNWPAETIRYVSWGTGIWADIQSESTHSQTIEDWLDAGGEYLCRQARESNTTQ